MITFQQAQQAVAKYALAQWWNRNWGTFHVSPNGFEDDKTFLVVVGASEFLVDGNDDHVVLDAPVFLALKDSGEVVAANALDVPVETMTPVSTALTAAGVKKLAEHLWDESLHPRDKNGKFIKKGALVQLANGQTGKVVGVTKGAGGKPKLTVETTTGTVTHPNAIKVAVTKEPTYRAGDTVSVDPTVTGGDNPTIGTVVGEPKTSASGTIVQVKMPDGKTVPVFDKNLTPAVSAPQAPTPTSKPGDKVSVGNLTGTVTEVKPGGEVTVKTDHGLNITVLDSQVKHADASAPAPAPTSKLNPNGTYAETPKVGDRVVLGPPMATTEMHGVVTKTYPGGQVDVAWDKSPDYTMQTSSYFNPVDKLQPEAPAAAPKLNADGTYAEPPPVGTKIKTTLGDNHGTVTAVNPDGTVNVDDPSWPSDILNIDPSALEPDDEGSTAKDASGSALNVGDSVKPVLMGGPTGTVTKISPDGSQVSTSINSPVPAVQIKSEDDGHLQWVEADMVYKPTTDANDPTLHPQTTDPHADDPEPETVSDDEVPAQPTWDSKIAVTDVAGNKIDKGDTVYVTSIDRKAVVVGNLPPDYGGESPRLIVQDPDTKDNHVVPTGNVEKVTDPKLLFGQEAEDALPTVKLTPTQWEALDDYTGSGYSAMNGELRNYDGDLVQMKSDGGPVTEVKRLDAAIKKSTLPQSIMVYRGMHHTHPGHITTGTTFRDWGFISTTTDRNIADGFGPSVLMQLQLPAGQHALSVDNNGGGSQGGAEDEILLPRGQAFFTTNVIELNGRTIIQAKPIDNPTGPVLSSANPAPALFESNEGVQKEKSAMQRYAERLIWDPEDVEIISQPEPENPLTAAAAANRFAGDPEKFFGGDKKFPKGPHLGSWDGLKKANPGSPEKVSHVGPDEVLFATQGHHDRHVAATYRHGGEGPHADGPAKVFHHTKTGRKHVVNGHHRILADRIHGRATPVIYLGGGTLPGDGSAGDSGAAPAAGEAALDVFGAIKQIKDAWKEALHPRDHNGRFVPKGSHVTLGDGSTGQVVGASKLKNGEVALHVKRDNGTTAIVKSDTTTVQSKVPGTSTVRARVIHSNPRVPSADLMKSIKDNGGFTYDPKTGGLMVPGKDSGIAVAVPGTEQIVGNGDVSRQAFAKSVAKVLTAHKTEIAAGAKLGGWYSEDRNAYMVELTDVLPGDNREAAIAEGKKRNQEGIFDIGKNEYIPTGGTGDGKTDVAPDVVSGAPPAVNQWTDHDPATWTPRQQEAYDTAGKVIDKYAAIQPQVTKQLQDVTNGLTGGATLSGLDFKLKTQKSLARKLHDKTLDPQKGTIPEYAANVGDALRYTQLSDQNHLADNAKATLAALQQKGWTVKEVGNTWQPGEDYKGINTNLTSPDGQHTFELQFHTPQSLAVKEKNHQLYDITRLPETPAEEKDRLEQQMVANAATIPQPPGIESVTMPTTSTPPNVDPLATASAPVPASPVGKDFRNMTPSQKITATAMMYGTNSKQYRQALKKWGKGGA